MYLVINKCVTAVKVSNFSGHYLRNRSTLDTGVLGYIGIVQHKEHSLEVLSISPGTPCICMYVCNKHIRRKKNPKQSEFLRLLSHIMSHEQSYRPTVTDINMKEFSIKCTYLFLACKKKFFFFWCLTYWRYGSSFFLIPF